LIGETLTPSVADQPMRWPQWIWAQPPKRPVRAAMKRDIYTGGAIRTFTIGQEVGHAKADSSEVAA